jgi:hypothetical protein
MRTCSRATRLISDGLDRSLSLTERLSLTIHLAGCPPCRRFRRAARWLHTVLVSPPDDDIRLPADARDRIRRALEQATDNE